MLSVATRANVNTIYFGKLCLKNQLLWGVQLATDYLRKAQLHASLSGNMPNKPALIVAQIPAALALEINTKLAIQLNGVSPEVLARLKKHNARISVSLMTDTDTLRGGRISMREMLLRDAGRMTHIGAASQSAQHAAHDSGQLIATHKQILKMAREQVKAGTLAAAHLGQLLSGPTSGTLDAVVNGIDGRLAIGGLVVQVLGFGTSLQAYLQHSNSSDAEKRAEVSIGLLDSATGLLAGMTQLVGVGVEGYTEAKYGAGAAANRLLPAGFRIAGGVLGVAGALISAYAMGMKRDTAERGGDSSASSLFSLARYAYLVNLVSSSFGIAGSIGETAIARGATSMVVRAVATRLGANGILVAIGGVGLSISGIGLVFLGAGLALQFGAMALTPSILQKWISRSYFGKNHKVLWFSMGSHENKFLTLKDELTELDELLGKLPQK